MSTGVEPIIRSTMAVVAHDLVHLREVDDVAAVHPQEQLGVQPAFQVADGEVAELAALRGVHPGVVPLRADELHGGQSTSSTRFFLMVGILRSSRRPRPREAGRPSTFWLTTSVMS